MSCREHLDILYQPLFHPLTPRPPCTVQISVCPEAAIIKTKEPQIAFRDTTCPGSFWSAFFLNTNSVLARCTFGLSQLILVITMQIYFLYSFLLSLSPSHLAHQYPC